MTETSEVHRRTLTTTTTTVHQNAPHSLVITRSKFGGSPSGLTSSRTSTVRTRSMVPASDPGFSAGAYVSLTTTGVNAVKDARDQERKDMQDLNDRFADYIDKVRNLEAMNRKLADELEKLKSKWGKETSQIKAMYQAELDEARQALNDAEKEKARLEIRVASLEDQIEELRIKLMLAEQELAIYREKLSNQARQLLDYESEIQLLRKQLEGLENEKEKDQKTIAQLQDALNRAREDLDIETLAHIDAENRRQTLEEEIEFLKSVHEQEMKELAALAYADTLPETRDFWKNELQQAIREIQQMYEEKMDLMRADLENNYSFKLQEMRTGAAKQTMESTKSKEDCKELRADVTALRERINDLDNQNNLLMREIEALRRAKDDRERELEAENSMLRGEADQLRMQLDGIMRELQTILNTKMGLELEIAAYRKLLESEETRLSRRAMTDTMWSSTVDGMSGGEPGVRGEMSAKTTYQRAAKGPVTVSDCPPDGKSVTLENTGRKEESLEGWKIRRSVDGNDKSDYVLDKRFQILKPGAKITLWTKGAKPPSASINDVEVDETNWGVGAIVITKLVNPEGEERASLTQRTNYT